MPHRVLGSLLAAGALLATAGAAEAQPTDRRAPVAQARVYSLPGFRGQAVPLNVPTARLTVPFGSIQVTQGSWQLCEDAGWRGRCVTIRDNRGSVQATGLRRVGSLRPATPGGPEPVGPPPGGPGWGSGAQTGPSLAGMRAKFYSAPAYGRQRIGCTGGGSDMSCAKQAADRFCAREGYRTSLNVALQTEGRRVYLADVLCSR